jgi:hypothetical protein
LGDVLRACDSCRAGRGFGCIQGINARGGRLRYIRGAKRSNRGKVDRGRRDPTQAIAGPNGGKTARELGGETGGPSDDAVVRTPFAKDTGVDVDHEGGGWCTGVRPAGGGTAGVPGKWIPRKERVILPLVPHKRQAPRTVRRAPAPVQSSGHRRPWEEIVAAPSEGNTPSVTPTGFPLQ